jgi:hypothetical protein
MNNSIINPELYDKLIRKERIRFDREFDLTYKTRRALKINLIKSLVTISGCVLLMFSVPVGAVVLIIGEVISFYGKLVK